MEYEEDPGLRRRIEEIVKRNANDEEDPYIVRSFKGQKVPVKYKKETRQDEEDPNVPVGSLNSFC